MILAYLSFFTALIISIVAIYYSVVGLAAIFAAAVIPIIVMGVSLEIGKLVTAVWLHRYWRQAKWWLRTYLSVAVVVLMFITSMGIFGFLSKAHIEQTSLSQEQVALIETLDDKELRAEAKIDRWRGELDRLVKGEDVRVDSLIEKEQEGLDKIYARIKEAKDAFRADAKFEIEQQQLRIKQGQDRRDAEIVAAEKKFEGSLGGTKAYEDAVKKAKDNELSVASRAQAEILKINTQLDTDLKAIDAKYAKDVADINKRINGLRNEASNKTQDIEGRITDLEGWIEGEQKVIDVVREEKFGYEKQYRKLEAEVGPIKYIAEFIYGEQADKNLLEEAVRWVIIIIIFVFDPLAVLLLIASQETFRIVREGKGGVLPPKPVPDPGPEDSEPTDEEFWEKVSEESLRDAYDDPSTQQEPVKQSQQSKHSSQMLMFDNIDPAPQETAIKETILQEPTDSNQMEFDFENKNLNSETELDKWNEWVEAANRAAQENPEVDEDEDDVFADVTPEEKDAMQQWKQDTGGSLKLQRLLAEQGRIKNVPWLDYLSPQPDFVEDKKFQIMPELERLNKGKPQYTEVIDPKKKTLLNWMEKDGNQQIKKSKEMDE